MPHYSDFRLPLVPLLKQTDFTDIPISSIFVFHDPRNWALDVQVMSDIIRSYPRGLGSSYHVAGPPQNPGIDGRKGVELFFCNPDLLWKAQHRVPRFGQGAFKEAFQAVFKVSLHPGLLFTSRYISICMSQAATGSTYPYIQFGKPQKLTYDYGEKMLDAQREHLYNAAPGETTAM